MIRIEGQDYDGPNLENEFVPSIEIADEQENSYCIGLRYIGNSTGDPKNYVYDHTNLRTKTNPEGTPITEQTLVEILSSSKITLQQLKETFIQRIGHAPPVKD